jgi:hypothetical protein
MSQIKINWLRILVEHVQGLKENERGRQRDKMREARKKYLYSRRGGRIH